MRKSRLKEWLNDLRWALNMVRVRRMQCELSPDQRIRFFENLRPSVPNGYDYAYPYAMMYVTADDVYRAYRHVYLLEPEWPRRNDDR
jgi:hypothetical protein